MFGCAVHTPQKRVLINEISLWLCLFALFRASAKKYGDQNKNNNEKKHPAFIQKWYAANAYQFHTISSGITMKSFATAHATIYFNLCWHFFVVCLKLVSTKNLDDDWNNSVQFELKMGVCGINKRDIYIQIVCVVCHQSSYSVSFINLHAIIR